MKTLLSLLLGLTLALASDSVWAAKKKSKPKASRRGPASSQVHGKVIKVEVRKEGSTTIRKKFIYRSHTQVDFSGDTIQGKTRAPEVFYIFQRKRSEAHHVVKTPETFDYHRTLASDRLRRSLPK